MLKIRTVIVSAVLAVVLMLTVQLVNARTEVASDPSNNSAKVIQNQQPSANQNIVSLPAHRSSLDECFDVSLMELANCRTVRRASIPVYRSPLDECYDVPLREATDCLNARLAPVP